MSGQRSSQFQRVSKFAPSTNSQPIKNTKITRNTLGVHGSAGGKPGSPFVDSSVMPIID